MSETMTRCDKCDWDEGWGEHEEAHAWWEQTRDWTDKDWDQFWESAIAYSESMKGEA